MVKSNADRYLREESERVSELKSISGSETLPAGMLASGAEGIKDSLQGFDDAYVNFETQDRTFR